MVECIICVRCADSHSYSLSPSLSLSLFLLSLPGDAVFKWYIGLCSLGVFIRGLIEAGTSTTDGSYAILEWLRKNCGLTDRETVLIIAASELLLGPEAVMASAFMHGAIPMMTKSRMFRVD